jgi:PAS domain S-box-containing protein
MPTADHPTAFGRKWGHPRGWLDKLRRLALRLFRGGAQHADSEAARLRAILDTALDGIIVVDTSGRILEFNPAAERMFGFLREEAEGGDLCEMLVPPRLRAAHRRGFAAVVRGEYAGGARQPIQTTGVRANGNEFPIELAFAVLGGSRRGLFVAYVRDATERERVETLLRYQALLCYQDELKTIAVSTADALFLLDADGRITYANPAAERTLGWNRAELTGASLSELAHCSCDRARACPHGVNGSQCGSGVDLSAQYYDAVMFRKDGARIEVVCSCSPVIREGVVTGGVTAMRNVTDQRRAERKLIEVSRRLEAHLGNSPLAVLEFAPDGTILRWSAAAERLLGWPAGEIVGKNLAAFPWLTADLSPCDGVAVPEQAPRRPAAVRTRTRDGALVDVEWHRSEFRNAAGELVSNLWLGLDVTASNRAEEALRESEERFRATLEQAPAGIAHLDEQGRFLIVNDKYCQIAGYSREELLGRRLREITHPDDVAGDARNARALFDGAIPGYSREKRYVRKDGGMVWVNTTVSLVRASAGRSRSMLTIVTDISDRKRAEEHLQQSHDRYRFLADAMPHMVFTATPGGQADYHNRSWLAYTGQSFEAALGQGWATAVHPDDVDRYLAGWAAGVSAGVPYQMDARFRRADGEYRWHLVRTTPMRDQLGGIVEWVGAAIDTEDQKRAAAELERKVLEQTAEAREQARRAEQASLAKSEFLAMMSHEIRTPMNVIVGLAELIQESAMPEGQREYVVMLRRASATLLTVINDILDLSAVESRDLRIQRIPFDLDAVFRSVASVMESRARARGLELVCDLAGGVPRRLLGDPDRLHQILLNLIGNAIKFTEKGAVQVRVSGAAIDGSAELTFAVMDTGIGIPPEKQKLIFEPFTQADSSITRQYGGTGLGLTISRRLVELMQGRIWVESEPGHGSTFLFQVAFPVQEAEAPPTPAKAADVTAGVAAPRPSLPPHPGESLCPILLVDDSNDNVFLIKEFLKGSRYSVDVAENGVDALAKFNTGNYELILMDVQMPIMDGHTATRFIREWESENRQPAVPILALTAHALESEVEKSMQAGCTAHLTKPIQRQGLLSALAQYAGSRQSARITVTAPEGFEDLSRDYLARRKDGMRSLRDWLDRGDYDSVRRMAHDVKGTGAGYGFAPLTNVARSLEQAAATHDLVRMQSALNSMDAYLESVELAPRSGGSS